MDLKPITKANNYAEKIVIGYVKKSRTWRQKIQLLKIMFI